MMSLRLGVRCKVDVARGVKSEESKIEKQRREFSNFVAEN
jgi:hypothetical protein